jgi:hypothetical protein
MDANACDLQVSRDFGTQPMSRRRSRNLLGAQGRHRGVREDVSASELPGSRARSAVFLVHAESPRQAPCG